MQAPANRGYFLPLIGALIALAWLAPNVIANRDQTPNARRVWAGKVYKRGDGGPARSTGHEGHDGRRRGVWGVVLLGVRLVGFSSTASCYT